MPVVKTARKSKAVPVKVDVLDLESDDDEEDIGTEVYARGKRTYSASE